MEATDVRSSGIRFRAEGLRERFEPQGAAFDHANAADTPRKSPPRRREFGIEFLILPDPSQTVARAPDLRRTAEALVIETATWKVLYRGAVDDRLDYGQQKPAATRSLLSDALARLWRRTCGGEPDPGQGDARFTIASVPDYTRDIVRFCALRGVSQPGNVVCSPYRYEKVRGTCRNHSGRAAGGTGCRPGMRIQTTAPRQQPPSSVREKSLAAWIAAGAPRATAPIRSPAAQPNPAPAWLLGGTRSFPPRDRPCRHGPGSLPGFHRDLPR